MTDQDLNTRFPVGVASNYIIALNGDQEGAFVVCRPVLAIDKGDGNWGGLTQEQIATYIMKHALHAAPLPGRPFEPLEFLSGPGR